VILAGVYGIIFLNPHPDPDLITILIICGSDPDSYLSESYQEYSNMNEVHNFVSN